MTNTSLHSISGSDFRRNPNLSGRKSYRKYFPSHTAHLSGYYSKSHWIKQGRTVVDVEQPVLAVAKSWITSGPEDGDVVLEFGYFDYVVTNEKFFSEIGKRGCWNVYCERETSHHVNDVSGVARNMQSAAPIDITGRADADHSANNPASNKRNQEQLEQNFFSPLYSSSLDGGSIVNSDPKSNDFPVFTSNATTFTLNNWTFANSG